MRTPHLPIPSGFAAAAPCFGTWHASLTALTALRLSNSPALPRSSKRMRPVTLDSFDTKYQEETVTHVAVAEESKADSLFLRCTSMSNTASRMQRTPVRQ
jgi:hypothetical protein